jgi:hypothetical protein
MTDITVGKRLRSSVCDTEVIVVRGPDVPVELSCGGHPMTGTPASAGSRAGHPPPGTDGGTLLGKRYVDEKTGLEVLCTKPGAGGLAADGRNLTIKAPKALPASD